MRIIAFGDSTTTGSAGDYTWRYFFDRGLRANGVAFDLVGPSRGLFDQSTGAPSAAYADPAFDQDHAAAWGDLLLYPKVPLEATLQAYPADAMVVFEGGNDMFFMNVPPADVVTMVESVINRARALNPNLRIVVVANHHVDDPRIPELNARLASMVASTSTAQSPVALARVPDWNAATDTWDMAHPSQVGAFKLGVAVTDAFAGIGVGAPYPRPLVPPAEGLRTPATLTARAGVGSATLTWVNPPGATGTRIWRRTLTTDGDWEVVVDQLPGASWVDTGLTHGGEYEYRTQTWKGQLVAQDLYSAVVRVTAAGHRPRIRRVRASKAPHGALISWRVKPAATHYEVQWRRGRGRWQVAQAALTTPHLRWRIAGAATLRVRGFDGPWLPGPWSRALSVKVRRL